MGADVKNVAQTVIQTQDFNKDGKVDQIRIQQQEEGTSKVKTGIYNIRTPEGRAAAKAALLDLGLSMPEFLSPAGEQYISNLPKGMKLDLDTIAKSASAYTQGSQGTGSNVGTMSANLQGRWAGFMGKIANTGNVDVNALVQYVLREAYMENTKDLHFYAQKVRFYNDLKKNIREELTQARELMAFQAGRKAEDGIVYSANGKTFDGPNPYQKQEFFTEPAFDQDTGQWQVQPSKNDGKLSNKEDLETYIENLEEKLSAVGEDGQLANVDLQNMVQKQQQTLQMMSNLAKMCHDTAMAIIRKMGS